MDKVKPTSDMQLGRHARKAAQIMAERGWQKGYYEGRDGRVCLVGAFRRAVKPMGLKLMIAASDKFSGRFARWMCRQMSPVLESHFRSSCKVSSAEGWNDHIFTSEEETLAWLNKFADEMDPQRV